MSTTRRPASSMASARPVSSSAARRHPHLLAQRAAAPSHLVGQGAPPGARLRAAHTGVPGRPGGGRGGPGGPPAARSRPRRPGRCHPLPAGPGQATLIPMPTTTAVRVDPANSASARTPASLAPSSSRSLGHLRTGSTPATSRQASAPGQGHGPGTQVHVPAAAGGPQEHRGQQVRPRRRLPAAVEAAPSGGLVVGHGDEPGGSPLAGQVDGRRCWWNRPRRAGGCPTRPPHGRHHRVRAIVKVRLREERPA